MNILFLIGDLTLSGGTERSTIAIANLLSLNPKFKVHILSNFGGKSNAAFYINSEVIVNTLDCKNYKMYYFHIILGIRNYVKSNRINILLSVEVISYIFSFPATLFLGKFSRPKVVVWEHFNYTVTLGKKLRKLCRFLAAKYADVIVTLTEKDRLMWIENLQPKAHVVAINNVAPYSITEQSYNVASKLIIAVGRLTYQKGFDRLIEIWSKYIQNNPETSWKLQIIGSGEDHSLIVNLIEKHNLSDSVRLIPNVTDIYKYYESASILVMTSRFEGLPMVLIEAQSFGLPIISYDCITGPSDIVINNTGVLVKENDINDFVTKLQYLIDSPSTRILMSDNAKLNVFRFSPENITNEWCKLLEF